ncbi:MAG: methyl-accepting chemotaxis protein [Pseudomonadota bacterium]
MKNLSLRFKLIAGFVLVALLNLGVGLVGWVNSRNLSHQISEIGRESLPAVSNLLQAREAMQTMRVAQRTLLNPEADAQWRQRQFANIEQAQKTLQRCLTTFGDMEHLAEERELWQKLAQPLKDAAAANQEFLDQARQLEQTHILNPVALLAQLEAFRADLYKLMADTGSLLLTGVDAAGGGDPNITPFGRWLAAFSTENDQVASLVKLIKSQHEAFHAAVKSIKEAVGEGAEAEGKSLYQTRMIPAAEQVFRAFDAIIREADKARQAYAKMNESSLTLLAKTKPALDQLNALVAFGVNQADQAVTTAESEAATAGIIAWAGVGLGLVLALALGLGLSLIITRGLGRIIGGLGQGSEQVAAAAGQVRNSSQSLASGASQQAASLEETTAALEELASMTKTNADNAQQANQLAQETNQVVVQANQTMGELTGAMQQIQQASRDTGKIIKTIDEIAFQTNLLALNAAVEAARAGEAGAGFAVVADEVRNLAMRAAEAAKNTTGLIEQTLARVGHGAELVEHTSQDFNQVQDRSRKVAELVAEIAAASREQSQGIDQVNQAALEMDRVTQQNAANAEESAAASEELSAQAETTQGYVQDLMAMVGGRDRSARGRAASAGLLPAPAPAARALENPRRFA